jgi:signal transduction histidine kinase/ligand-binding sensor domain-containing protein/DNA-binding response OmpR family regulator
MNPFLKHLFIFLIFLSPFVGISQQVRFKHLSINDGLSQNTVFSISQDHDGFMWFGTKDGLNKFDGYSFTVYHNELNNSNSIDANYITALYTDSHGTLWAGTENGMVNRYLKSSDSFERIALPLLNSLSKNTTEIKVISEDRNGTIWVGTGDNGIFKLPISNNQVEHNGIKQYYQDEKQKSLSNNTIRGLYADEKGFLWIATEEGLNRMDINRENFTSFYFDIKHSDTEANTSDLAVTAIYPAGYGYLWLGTLSGLVKFNTNDFSHEVFTHHFNIYDYGWGGITKIVKDNKDNLWLASIGELMSFDTKTKTFTSYKNNPLIPESLIFNGISGLFIDRSNIVWAGTTGMGISYYDPKTQRFSLIKRQADPDSRINGFSVYAIAEENDRYVWISAGVLYRWDRKKNILKSFESDPNFLDAFGNLNAWSILKSRDGNLWFTNTRGLFVLNPKSGKTRHYKYNKNDPKGIPQKGVANIYEDKKGFLWIVSENYLSKMTNRENGTFKHFQYLRAPAYQVYVRPVIFEDRDNKIWLGTNNGLLVFDQEKESFFTYKNHLDDLYSISNNHIKTICPDPEKPDKFLWIGTAGGLNLFDKTEGKFTHFTEKDGLPNNVVYGILTDNLNNLWLSTNKGISKFNPKERSFRNFDVDDGLQSNEFNTGAYYKSNSGEMFFGGISGLNHFSPEKIKDNPFLPQLALTGINVYNKNQNSEAQTSFSKISVFDKESLSFNRNDNIITFEFAALDFSTPAKNQYAYKLENFNEDWIYIKNNRSATFTNLPPGKYIFRAKASNNDGVWNEAGIAIPIEVLPLWSGTWSAYFLYFILLLILLYLIRKYELKRFNIKNQLEVERIETETLRRLDRLKSRFFTNISHEFRTPLTLISGEAEDLLENLKPEHPRSQIRSINKNASRLLQLINQILDVSKLEAGKMELHPIQNNIVLFLKNLFYSIENYANKKNIKLLFSSENNNIQMLFDPEKMEKIINNLLFNAMKFTPEHGTISLRVEQKDPNLLKISVSDTGIGISKKDLSFIFDRFYQVDNSDTRAYEGTGIGLALAKELVELHQGNISAINNPNYPGTTFIIELPLGEIKESQVALEIPEVIKPYNNTPVKRNVHKVMPLAELDKKIILIVEDNPDIRQFIKEQLNLNYKVIEAEDGDIGFELAQQIIPDLIITDVMMPKMNGFSMVKHLKENEKSSHIPIIMLTGKSSYEDKIEGLETGVDTFLTKPFSPKELRIHISNLIGQREKLRAKYKNAFSITPNEIPASSVDKVFLEKTIQLIKINLDNPNFSVEELAEKMCLSSSQLHRKLQALIDQAPGQVLRNMRLQKAAGLIKLKAWSIAAICDQTGFNDQAYFSRAFKKQFGCSPTAFKKDRD